jgi:hypothetical protein
MLSRYSLKAARETVENTNQNLDSAAQLRPWVRLTAELQ